MSSIVQVASARATSSEPPGSVRNHILFLAALWVVALLPFLLWRGTWFGRPLSDQQIGEYLHDNTNPTHVQHALTQLADRMQRRDESAVSWYPDVVRLASFPVEDVRATAAISMGFDPSRADFHDALRVALKDPSPAVRANAAVALANFGDASGHDELILMLQPSFVVTHEPAHVVDVVNAGASVKQLGSVAHLRIGTYAYTVRAPIAGKVAKVNVKADKDIAAGTQIAVLEPSADEQLEALRALYAVGEPEDLPMIEGMANSPDAPEKVRQQASLTDRSIRDRASTKGLF
jgi:biotin carboxyl carrier protein